VTSARIGAIEVVRVEEMLTPGFDPAFLFPDWDPAILDRHPQLREPTFRDPDSGRLMSSMQSWLVRAGDDVIIVDTGCGNGKTRSAPAFRRFHDLATPYLDRLAAAGVRPEDVTLVVNTHLHVDHVGWNTQRVGDRWVPTFPNARYVFSQREFDHWQAMNAKSAVLAFQDSVLPVIEAGSAELVADDHTIGDHVRILPTPGHTPGHVAVALGKGRDEAVASGDLIHSPLQARLPDLSTKFDVDQAQAASTRRAFLERYCDTGTLCCMAHFPSPSVTRITRRGNGFDCSPVTG